MISSRPTTSRHFVCCMNGMQEKSMISLEHVGAVQYFWTVTRSSIRHWVAARWAHVMQTAIFNYELYDAGVRTTWMHMLLEQPDSRTRKVLFKITAWLRNGRTCPFCVLHATYWDLCIRKGHIQRQILLGPMALDQSASLILIVSTGTEKRMLAHIFLQGSQEHDACINYQAGQQWQSFEGG